MRCLDQVSGRRLRSVRPIPQSQEGSCQHKLAVWAPRVWDCGRLVWGLMVRHLGLWDACFFIKSRAGDASLSHSQSDVAWQVAKATFQ